MATLRDFPPRLVQSGGLHGTCASPRSGTVYTIATDARGVVSCSCLGWLHDAESKRGERKGEPRRPRRAIEDRWCSHLRGIQSGELAMTPRYMPTDDRGEKLATAHAELARMKTEMDQCRATINGNVAASIKREARAKLDALRESILNYSESVGLSAVDALAEEA